MAVGSDVLEAVCLLAGGEQVFPSCWLFCLRLHSTRTFGLLAGARCWCDVKMAVSRTAHTNEYFPEPLPPVYSSLQ